MNQTRVSQTIAKVEVHSADTHLLVVAGIIDAFYQNHQILPRIAFFQGLQDRRAITHIAHFWIDSKIEQQGNTVSDNQIGQSNELSSIIKCKILSPTLSSGSMDFTQRMTFNLGESRKIEYVGLDGGTRKETTNRMNCHKKRFFFCKDTFFWQLKSTIYQFNNSTIQHFIKKNNSTIQQFNIFSYLCKRIRSPKGAKRECREIRQQSRCCKLKRCKASFSSGHYTAPQSYGKAERR